VFTEDGGTNWDSSFVDTAGYPSVGPIFFIDNQNGVIFGSKFFETTDGGVIWKSRNSFDTGLIQNTTTTYFLNQGHGISTGVAPQATDAGFLVGTADSGTTWNYLTTPHNIELLTGIDFPDSLIGFAVGSPQFGTYGAIYSTRDGGKSWSYQTIPGAGLLYDVGFLDTLHGWITGSNGQIWHTTDGGSSWNLEQTTSNANLRKISVLKKENIAFVFGDTNTIYESDLPLGINNAGPYLPSAFKLYQNHPNPFNPTTTIQYQLPSESRLRLMVYNLLGQVVAELVNGVESVGYKSVDWNAGNFSSGVYFYRLEATSTSKPTKSFTSVKKMLLIK